MTKPVLGYAYSREKMLLWKYGITPEDFEKMLDEQNGCCCICRNNIEGVDEKGKLLANIDHNHKTEVVRGLLCQSCNQGLGFFKDNIRILAGAIVYLQDHS